MKSKSTQGNIHSTQLLHSRREKHIFLQNRTKLARKFANGITNFVTTYFLLLKEITHFE